MNRFLQSMQEREAERLKRESQKVSVQATEREEFSNQLGNYEKDVRCYLQECHIHDAELTLGSLRSFVQDAVQTLSLTSYDMARANATVAKLQHEVDDAVKAHRNQRLETEHKRESADQHYQQKEIEEEPLTMIINEHSNKETTNSEKSTLEERNNNLNSASVFNSNNNDTSNKDNKCVENTCIGSSTNTNNNNSITSKQEGCKGNSKRDIHNTHKKFSFSSRCKTKMENKKINASTVKDEQKVDSNTVSQLDKTNDMSIASSQAKCYGPLVNETITIPPAKAIFVNECTHCTILTFPIAGSAFICNCRECTIYLACHQLRMKDCENVEVYVACTSHPIIEHCNDMRFGPYSCWTGLLMSSVELIKPENVIDHSHTAEEAQNHFVCCNDVTSKISACDNIKNKNNYCLTTIINNTADKAHDGNSMNKELTSEQILNASQNISFTSLEEWLMYIGRVRNVTDALMNYRCVDDFQWLKKIASPHWRCLSNRDEMTMNSTIATVTVDDESIVWGALIHRYKHEANRNTDNNCNEEDDDVKVNDNVDKSSDKCR